MPKKKKTKETSTTEFKFDYRYTPKPYFTAPSTTAGSSGNSPQTNSPLNSRAAHPLRARTSLNPDAWQAQKQRNYGYSSYAKAATSATPSGKKTSSIEVTPSAEETTPTNTSSKKDQDTIRKVFEEMFRGRVDVSVINMVLQDVNWNENEALDTLSQIAPEDNSQPNGHLASGFDVALTPDHNLTPTAPTLSYSSSITSLDEYGVEYCRNLTQRNLSQVADMLRNGDDINDLDRQRLARSRATTPRTLIRNGNLTVKNITLGSTESLESNRSLFGQDPPGITSSASASADTPKKTNFEKSISLHDISSADAASLTLTAARDQVGGSGLNGTDSGTIESLLIPLDHGDIVLEKGTYDSLLNDEAATPQPELTPPHAGPLPHSASISDYSQAISSLTTQLTTDKGPEASPADEQTKSSAENTWKIGDSSLAAASPQHQDLLNGTTSLSNGAASLPNGATSLSSDTSSLSHPPRQLNGTPGLTNGAASSPSDTTGLSNGVPGPSVGQSTTGEHSKVNGGLEGTSSAMSYSQMLSTTSSKDKPYPYDGLLGSGTAVPTAFESARPKKPKAPPKVAVAEAEEMNVLMDIAASAAEGEKVMFLLRGAPGSGKSTLGRSLIAKSEGQVFSGDDFFTDSRGQYNWNPTMLEEAHTWNKSRVHKACEAGITPIVVDNTHLQGWELEPYIKLCLQNAYRPVLAEPNTPWRYKAKELYKKNTHHVPYVKIKSMLERFEHKITVQQLIERVSSKDQQLQAMAEQLKSVPASSKLSRKKTTSKTIKRNKQDDTVEKFKDKKVELVVDLPKRQDSDLLKKNHSDHLKMQGTNLSKKHHADLLEKHHSDQLKKPDGEQDDEQGETEIMYPSAATLSKLKKSSTLKVLNSEKPKANGTKSGTREVQSKPTEGKLTISDGKPGTSEPKSVGAGAEAPQLSKATEKPSGQDIEKEVVKDQNRSSNKITAKSENRHSLAGDADNANAEDSREKSAPQMEELLVTPIATPLPVSKLDKSASVDTGLSKSRKDRSGSKDQQIDPSPSTDKIEVGVETRERLFSSGSISTMSHSYTLADRQQVLVPTQTASLPRLKDKSKSRTSSKKSTSTSILNVDVEQMGRWLSNDWAAPPYPSKSAAPTVTATSTAPVESLTPDTLTCSVTSASAPMSTMTNVTSSLGTMVSSVNMAVPPAGHREPPPPYEEHESSESAPVASCHDFIVKTKESWTLTEPSDYAMAYKAMQRNQQLPEGWVMITGHSKEPYPMPASLPHSSVLTHDKGTIMGEDDIPTDTPSSEDLAAESKLDRLHTCFPQLTKHQLSEFLELCKGDETWATNLLLDSNKVSLVKKGRKGAAVLSVAGLNKRLASKCRSGKGSFVERFNKAIVPVTSCLGKAGQPLHPLTQDNVTLRLTQQQATDLHTAFGRGAELPSSLSSGEVTVDVPRWIAHKIYRCMTDGTLAHGTNEQTIPSASALPIRPVRPPRRHKKRRLSPRAALRTSHGVQSAQVSLDSQVDQVKEMETAKGATGLVTGDVITSLGADWTIVDNADAPPAYAQEDEELARKLQTEDLMDVIKSSQPTAEQRLAIIADEQYARSLMAEEVTNQCKPNLSTKLKRQKLYELFAGVDKTFIDEVFKSCGYNLEQSIEFLSVRQGQGPAVASTMLTSQSKERMGSPLGRSTESPSRVLSNGTLSSRESTPGRDISSSEQEDQWFDVEEYVTNAEYVDYRAEANLHLRQRKQYLEKAALANSKRKYPVSTYYAEQAEHHYQKYREANLAAATQIFNNSNASRSRDEVDLHGLHADEAVQVVSEIIKTLRKDGKRKYVNIITGRGNRSKNGVSRIKQAVENFLLRNKIIYRLENPGMIRVTL